MSHSWLAIETYHSRSAAFSPWRSVLALSDGLVKGPRVRRKREVIEQLVCFGASSSRRNAAAVISPGTREPTTSFSRIYHLSVCWLRLSRVAVLLITRDCLRCLPSGFSRVCDRKSGHFCGSCSHGLFRGELHAKIDCRLGYRIRHSMRTDTKATVGTPPRGPGPCATRRELGDKAVGSRCACRTQCSSQHTDKMVYS